MVLVRDALEEGEELLREGGQGNARNESRWALCSVLGISTGELSLRQSDDLDAGTADHYRGLLRRRAHGEPFQYILGDVEFGDLLLQVGPGVLIPRPETEELVEYSGDLLKSPGLICDVCTGSGAICLSLGKRFPAAHVYGTDLSAEALVWARKNLESSGLKNVTLVQGDLFSGISDAIRFDLVVSNPPYVSEEEYKDLDPVVRDWEPKVALVAEDDGLCLLRKIAEQALMRLSPGGWLACEMGERHGAAMRSCLESLGYEKVSVRKDLSGRDRMFFGQRSL